MELNLSHTTSKKEKNRKRKRKRKKTNKQTPSIVKHLNGEHIPQTNNKQQTTKNDQNANKKRE